MKVNVNSFTRFIWWCSGAVIPILENTSTDHSKYFGIGGAILSTWILATLSGGYAFYFMLDDKVVAIIGGLVWGWVIFNLDRFITSSMKKRGDSLHKAFFFERIGHFLAELMPAIPRFFIAIIISFSISVPLELKLFEKEINDELKLIKQQDINHQVNAINQIKESKVSKLKEDKRQLILEYEKMKIAQDKNKALLFKDREKYQNEINAIFKEIDITTRKLQNELNGLSSGKVGYGRIARGIQKRIDALDERRKRIQKLANKQIQNIDENIEAILKKQNMDTISLTKKKAKIDARILKIEQQFETKNTRLEKESIQVGFLTKVKALYAIADKPGNEAVGWAQNMIIILILLIETGPILVKLLSARGHYEAKIDSIVFINSMLLDKEVKMVRLTKDIQFIMNDKLDPETNARNLIKSLHYQKHLSKV